MKLFCLVLVIYVVALTLFGVDGRGGGTTNGVEDPKFVGLFKRARRSALDEKLVANEPPPPPKQFRQRRQAPPGLPPPPEGMPVPPQFVN
ncbi:uncharacterized protein LOC110182936 [Drosophila serrata]|uniref:uncharacterized protein LOC110182936 n=1 Tax=Drosophila serrata TaxID=7274 RepID=UPI000A1D0E28|nr:uncharacterized protein LOC110182936 [Drosophila serrata]